MFGLTPLGTLHTAISLVALGAGFIALASQQEISTRSRAGRAFAIATVLVCLTGFGIFERGGFGKPHILGIVTLLVLAVAFAAERLDVFGRASRYVGTVGYSLAFFLHFIPGTVETLLRLPVDAPFLSNPDDPKAQPVIGVFFVLFLIGAALQVLRLHRAPAAGLVGRRAPR